MPETKAPGKIVHHKDVKAMSKIAEAMDTLDDTADRESVIDWFWRKYDCRAATRPAAPEGKE